MKKFRALEIATICTALATGFALASCGSDENWDDEDFGEVHSALTSVTIQKGAVTIRKGPGVWYERVSGLSSGKTVDVSEERGGWLKIKYGETEGWIYRGHTDAPSVSTVTCTEEVANHLRDKNPDGYNILFAYNGSDQASEFHSQANQFSKEYYPVNVVSGKLEKGVYKKITKYTELKSAIIDTGKAVVQCLADHPRPGFDDARVAQVKNLTIMSHGLTYALNLGGGSSNYFHMDNIKDFGSQTYGYLNNNNLRVQLYACNTARVKGTDENWYERYSGNIIKEQDPFTNGKGSFAQKLSEELGPNATVFGHTTAGHLSGNYAARCYGKEAGGAINGKHMFDVYFPASFVEEQANRLGQSKDTVRTSMYTYYRRNKVFPGDNSGRDTFMDPEGKGKSMRKAWLAENP